VTIAEATTLVENGNLPPTRDGEGLLGNWIHKSGGGLFF
jgi:hypothetical protein